MLGQDVRLGQLRSGYFR